MKVEKLKLSGSCDFTLTTFEGIEHKSVCLEYTEHATDHWNSDSETSIDLDAEKAREIIALLHKAFPALAATPPAAPVQEPTVEENSQDWAGMDGATAWHLIHRHADGWADVAKMMGEWLAANTPPTQPAVPLSYEQIESLWDHGLYVHCSGITALRAITRAIEAAHGITEKGGAA